MSIPLLFLIPTTFLALLVLWTWALIETLRREQSYWWLLFVLFLPPVAIPVYFVNFFLLNDPIGKEIERIRLLAKADRLREQIAESDILARREELYRVLIDLEKWQQAVEELGILVDRDDTSLRYQLDLGRCLLQLEKPQNAAAHLRFVVDSEPRYSQGDARLFLALALEQIGDVEGAIFELREAISYLERPRFLYELARIQMANGQEQEAQAMLRRLLESHRDDADFFAGTNRKWANAARKLLRD
ncbi:MAG: tetratricopeptide repeat protein [Candidatus Sumerlaeia bacterium]|nr:tetratricopeptide repeat protein [Candidatus Sumerlaeia bacterium]